MNNSESPLPKDDLCQLWLQLAQQFWSLFYETTYDYDQILSC
jgi:hypothetical protein